MRCSLKLIRETYRRNSGWQATLAILSLGLFSACAPSIELREPSRQTPPSYDGSTAIENSSVVVWKEFFQDPDLIELIDIALKNNQELNIFLQELEIAKNEIYSRSGAYLPFLDLGMGAGIEKPGKYTRNGAVEESLEVAPGKKFPEPLQNYTFGTRATWEVDIWRRLRNAQQAALSEFIASQEGRNFLVTNLISEIANLYYELRALDSELSIVQQNVAIQRDALNTVRLQKDAARVTELAVRRFNAQLLKTESLQYDIQQKIVETENHMNFLLGRFPQPIKRKNQDFVHTVPHIVNVGLPSQLLQNRADIRRAEAEIAAANLDVSVAQAAFYPSLNLSAELGYEAYRMGKIIRTPESLLYSLTGGLTGPFLNRRAITADFYNANAKQIQAVLNYERTVLNAFVESANHLSNIKNLNTSVSLRTQQVEALTSGIEIANTLFTNARADYAEVLLTQREAIESKFELVEAKMKQMQAVVNLYRALGGGWERKES